VKPIVALIGRPNVGKSTLFNRLVGKRLAIVHDRPGVTRDRHYAEASVYGRDYTLIDTGGFDPFGDDDMKQGITSQIRAALDEADVIVCVLDARVPPTSIDSEEVNLLRRAEKPVIFLANKCDSARAEAEGNELYRLGMDHLIFGSALHGRGIANLEDALLKALPKAPDPIEAEHPSGSEESVEGEEEVRPLRIAVVGRPNAGKSSLINRLAGEARLLVDSRPGTTRDAIDMTIARHGREYVFVDTAGVRRKAKVNKARDAVESMSVLSSIRTIDRSDVVVLMCDGNEGVAEQDAKILGLALDRGKAVVIALNKMDLLSGDEGNEASLAARDVLSFVPWAPVTRLSAKTGRGIDRLLKLVDKVNQGFTKRVRTGELNRFFENVLASHPPPIHRGRSPRFYFLTQALTRPPTFVIITSHPDSLHFSYKRYVVNAIRKQFGFEGTPIRVYYRRKDRRPKKGRKN
jgi:GTPase